MSTSRKRKSVSYEEPDTSFSEPEYDEYSFKPSTSKFNYIEEEALKMKFYPRNSFNEIIVIENPVESELPSSRRFFRKRNSDI